MTNAGQAVSRPWRKYLRFSVRGLIIFVLIIIGGALGWWIHAARVQRDVLAADSGLAHLKSLSKLYLLDLTNTKVSDAGLANLTVLSKLKYLDLDGTEITDAGLAQLAGLTALSSINAKGTKVTDAGEKQLKQTLPNLNIYRY
jgi:hypothetical protein